MYNKKSHFTKKTRYFADRHFAVRLKTGRLFGQKGAFMRDGMT